jgi:hypothetical protein
MICHVNFVCYNPITKKRRGILTYFKKNGITTLKKHVDADHAISANIFEEEVNSPLRNILERQLAKKRPNVSNFEISKFFGAKDIFKKDVVQQKQFLQDLALLVVKTHLLIQFVVNIWLKRLVMHLCRRVVFLSRKTFSQEVLVDLVEKTKEECMLFKLKQCYSTTTSLICECQKVHMMFLH